MYRKIMVPLDGSQFSECSLEHVKAIAIGCQVPEVLLLRVVEPLSSNDLAALAQVRAAPIEQLEAEKKSEASDYISGMVQKLNSQGVSARGEITFGKADEQILHYADKNHIDLIIMSTHGRSGVSRWAFGSVADRVVRHSTVPVLTVAPAGCRIGQS
jgi:nucleotide-binding universal stress UspA family protein